MQKNHSQGISLHTYQASLHSSQKTSNNSPQKNLRFKRRFPHSHDVLSFQNIEFLETFLDLLQCKIYLLIGVCCHKRETDKGILRRYSRRNNGINKDSLFEQVPRNLERLVIIADKQRNDRRCRVPYLTPYATETIKGVMGNVPQMLNTFGFTFDNVECCRNSSRRCWCNTCTENIGTRVMT